MTSSPGNPMKVLPSVKLPEIPDTKMTHQSKLATTDTHLSYSTGSIRDLICITTKM